jgi:hypothetical protein
MHRHPHGSTTHAVTVAAALVAVVALLLAGCSGGGGSGAAISVKDAWARTSPMVASAGAAYMVISNTGSTADALVGAASPVAATVEVHETTMMAPSPGASGGMGMASPAPGASMGTGGMLGMQKVDRVEIPAGGSLELKPGSYHIMLLDLQQDLVAGEQIEITLTFEKAGQVKVNAEVRAQ